MNVLPDELKPNNEDNFKILYSTYFENKLRESIYINILNNDENDYFDLDIWVQKSKFNKKIVDVQEILKPILLELKGLNWYYTFSYGKTALFIHKEKDPPKNCYNNEYEEI